MLAHIITRLLMKSKIIYCAFFRFRFIVIEPCLTSRESNVSKNSKGRCLCESQYTMREQHSILKEILFSVADELRPQKPAKVATVATARLEPTRAVVGFSHLRPFAVVDPPFGWTTIVVSIPGGGLGHISSVSIYFLEIFFKSLY